MSNRRGANIAPARAGTASAAGLAELPGGKLLLGGSAWNEITEQCVLLVARYNADGTLDSSFGSGGVEMVEASVTEYEWASAMAVQSDGKVVLGGVLADDLGNQDVLVARLMEDPQNPGQLILDDDFGTAGLAVLDAGTYDDLLDLKVDAAGRIVAGGEVDGQWWAARFTADGGLDSTFGTISGQSRTGWRTVDFTGSGYEHFAALDVDADGRVVLGGSKSNQVVLARLTEAGDDDSGFSDDGRAALSGFWLANALDLALRPDGRIVLAGVVVEWYPTPNYFVMSGRVNLDGTMDGSFGEGGWSRLDLTGVNTEAEQAMALALQADGKVVLAGRVDPGTELFVARLSGMTRHYAMQDANWNLTGIVDPATGQAVERYVFTPYGGRTVLDSAFESRSTSSFGWIVGHQGLAVDVETGLVYNRARYLDTSMGRFTIRDPLGYVDGMSLYQYVTAAPTKYVDPSGLLHVSKNIELWGKGDKPPTKLDRFFHSLPGAGTWHDAQDLDSAIMWINSDIVMAGDRTRMRLIYDPNSTANDRCTFCYNYVTISAHGSSGAMGLATKDLTRNSFSIYKRPQSQRQNISLQEMDFLAAIKARLCKKATVRFVVCESASLRRQLAEFFGEGKTIITYEGNVRWGWFGPSGDEQKDIGIKAVH